MKKAIIFFMLLLTSLFYQAQVIVYADCNYKGISMLLKEGSYKNSNYIGVRDNTISSIRVSPGYSATIYMNADFKGREVVLNESVACLPTLLNNDISSIIVKKTGQDEGISNSGNVSVYRGCNYRGSVKNFKPGSYNIRTSLNGGTPESLQIPEGLIVEFYDRTNQKGKLLMVYTSNVDCLPAHIVSTVKSIKIRVSEKNPVEKQPR